MAGFEKTEICFLILGMVVTLPVFILIGKIVKEFKVENKSKQDGKDGNS